MAAKTDDIRGDEFAAVSYDTWLRLVEADPTNHPFERKLTTLQEDGVRIQPLYALDAERQGAEGLPGSAPYVRGAAGAHAGWDVRQMVDVPDLTQAAAQARDELERGATSIALRIGPDALPITEANELVQVLEGVPLERCTVALEAGERTAQAAIWMEEVWNRRHTPALERRASFGMDPLGTLANRGTLPMGIEAALDELGRFATSSQQRHPASRAVRVCTAPYHDAGATAGQELSIALSTAVTYLRAMIRDGLDVDRASDQIAIRLQVGPDVFWEMAKLRAMRWIWGRVLEASGAKAPTMHLEACTSWRMMSARDPWVNLLRTTTAAFAGAAGGAEALTVLPFDEPAGVPDAFGRRLARNIQRLLVDEAHLHRVLDPGGGSYALERLTEELAERAWEAFQRLEAQGGVARTLCDGSLQEAIAAADAAQRKRVAERKLPLTGLSEFPNLREEPLQRQPRPVAAGVAEAAGGRGASAASSAATGAPETAGSSVGVTITPLPRRRIGADLEALRDASDRHLATTGRRPKAFLASLGKLASHNARSTWTLNLLAAGGIEAVGHPGLLDAREAGEAFTQSGADVAVICGSDEDYEAMAPSVAAALREAGAAEVWVAGRPKALEEVRKGADGHFLFGCLHAGQDVVAALRQVLAACGVAGVAMEQTNDS